VLKQRHEIELGCALTDAFMALVDVAARGRWGGSALVFGTTLPQAGRHYEQQRGKVLRRGKVLACLKPVSITLEETLLDPPCCVKLRLHWRIEPKDDGTCVLLDARYALNGAAALRRRHWYERIHGHCARMLIALEARVAQAEET
jgi:hypothetical protein